jgi:hypothetical protein
MKLWQEIARERVYLSYLILYGFVISMIRVQVSQDEDMGYLLSISSFVANGYRLYSEIFEIKDPLFFYSSALSIKAFGLIGPFILEVILITISSALAFLVGMQLQFGRTAAITSSAIFTMVLTGGFYQSFRTQILGIILFFLLTLLLLKRVWIAAGLVAVTVIATKMPIGAFILGLFPLVYFLHPKAREIFRLLAGTLLGICLFLCTLFFRGELDGYFAMIRENITYSQGYQQIVGLPSGFFGHLRIWDGDIGRAKILFLTCLFVQLFFWKNKESRKHLLGLSFLWGVFTGTFLFLGFTALWPHHLQILSIAAFASTLALSGIIFADEKVEGNEKKPKQSSRPSTHLTNVSSTKHKSLAGVLIAVIAVSSGALFSLNPRMPNGQVLSYEWRTPPEIELLNSIKRVSNKRIPIARLGMVDDAGFGGFLDHSRWEYVCKRLGIGGVESKKAVDAFLNCLDQQVQVVTLSPMYLNQARPGIFVYYKEEANRILMSKFTCSEIQPGGYQLCIKKTISNL